MNLRLSCLSRLSSRPFRPLLRNRHAEPYEDILNLDERSDAAVLEGFDNVAIHVVSVLNITLLVLEVNLRSTFLLFIYCLELRKKNRSETAKRLRGSIFVLPAIIVACFAGASAFVDLTKRTICFE